MRGLKSCELGGGLSRSVRVRGEGVMSALVGRPSVPINVCTELLREICVGT